MTQPKGTSPLDLMSSRLLLGYARVSTDDQDLTNQRAELHAAGCVKLFSEKFTGTRRDRPELARMLDHLRLGDVVTVTRLVSCHAPSVGICWPGPKARGVKFGPKTILRAVQIARARELIDEEGRP